MIGLTAHTARYSLPAPLKQPDWAVTGKYHTIIFLAVVL
jgi:hypothetical protein